MNVVLLGSGGFAREVQEYLLAAGATAPLKLKGYLDVPGHQSLLGDAAHLGEEGSYRPGADECFLLGMADGAKRAEVLARCSGAGWKSLNLIHPTAVVSPRASLGTGNVIGPFVYVGANAVLGDHNVFNCGCSVGHDSTIGSNNVFASNVQLAGYVRIGDANFFGISASVIPRLTIGNGSKVAAGTVVTANVPDACLYFHRDTNKVAFIYPQAAQAQPTPE
ncbi:MAG: acetyltransferase [Myxococcaceae bacterium]|nr:acetyltransferase [Myxococcaceae bacterium]